MDTLPGGWTCPVDSRPRDAALARATYTEDMQQDSSMLPLLVGEQVRGELVDGWKTRETAVSVIRGL